MNGDEVERLREQVATVLRMCEVWIEREPDCAGVRAIRDELRESSQPDQVSR